jgi:hypothetical protein
MKKFKFRTQYLINPQFQIQLIAIFLFLSLSIIGVVYYFNSYYFEIFMGKGQMINLPSGHPYYQLLNEQNEKMNNLFLYLSLIILTMVTLTGLSCPTR